jgi:hypothetical protein
VVGGGTKGTTDIRINIILTNPNFYFILFGIFRLCLAFDDQRFTLETCIHLIRFNVQTPASRIASTTTHVNLL